MSFRRILHRPAPKTDQSFITVNTIENDPLTRSILIDSASQQRGFLPVDYRIANTFESIHRQRKHYKNSSSKFPVVPLPTSHHRSTHFDAFGNSTESLSKLAEQRLILREKSSRKKHNCTPMSGKKDQPQLQKMSDADFATDIPSALDLMLKTTKRKSIIERSLFETMKRERLQQARYRLLPINRSTYA